MCVGELAGGLGGAVATWGREAGVARRRDIDTVDEIDSVPTRIDCGSAGGSSVWSHTPSSSVNGGVTSTAPRIRR